MSIKDWPGGIISKEQVVPSGPYLNSTASGVWTMDQAASYTKQGIWPTAGNAEPDVTSNFSTYLYEGNSGTLSVNNGIDFAGDGGLVWIKNRDAAFNNLLIDTTRGGNKYLYADNPAAEGSFSSSEQFALSSTGFSSTAADFNWNNSNYDYASWSFKKQAKFFTCLTYTGTGPGSGANEQQVSHDLGSKPGMVIIKRTDTSGDWWVFTDVIDGSNDYGYLNGTNVFANSSNNVATDTVFNVGGTLNTSGATYVAYLFANETDASSMVRCGSFGHNTNGAEVDLGWEPQWILFKSADQANDWYIFDAMRGIVTGGLNGDGDAALLANKTNAENVNTWGIDLTATGFILYGNNVASSGNIVYVAIRGPMMIAPTSPVDVFNVITAANTNTYSVGFPTDFSLINKLSGSTNNTLTTSRLMGDDHFLKTNNTDTQTVSSGIVNYNLQDSFDQGFSSSSSVRYHWKRAKGYADCVTYDGTGANRTVAHSMAVQPEMMWVKSRSNSESWAVYHASIPTPEDNYLYLNESSALNPNGNTIRYWNSTKPTSTEFTVGIEDRVNGAGNTYIAMLFATLPNISKVGTFTATGSALDVDCGFSSSARFVLLKRTDATGEWYVFDSERGITSSTSPYFYLDSTSSESTANYIDPLSTGFRVTVNFFGSGDFVFYAIR